MSWLNLKRLLRPRKAWKLFTNKLQIKLKKSKAIRKLPQAKPYKKYRWPYLTTQPKKFKLKPKHRRTPSVYVDRLLIEHVPTVEKRLDIPFSDLQGEAKEEKTPLKTSEYCEQKVVQLESSSGDPYSAKEQEQEQEQDEDEDQSPVSAADEMWESMVMNSTQMQGINERAEEFIARFRAQMHQQEMMERRL